MIELDPLRRIERNSVLVCAGMAVGAWALAPREFGGPLGVLAGGAIVGISYRGIRAGIDAAVGAAAGRRGGSRPAIVGLVKFFTRYAILAGAAYLTMARLRVPPVAVFAGASSVVVAVTIEALLLQRSGARNRVANPSSSQHDGRGE